MTSVMKLIPLLTFLLFLVCTIFVEDFTEFIQKLVSSHAFSYCLVGGFLYYLLAPHPAAFDSPRISKKKIQNHASWKEVAWKAKIAPMRTGKQYTIIGAGFFGKKLIHSLLLRGETKIRAFDMDPRCCEPFKGDDRVEFIRGDVTKYEQVVEAIRGSDVVYSTFAVIRFMDRLPSEVQLSYRVNVVGTENVVKACQECNVKILIQTSTSNVCVGLDSCTLDMDEKSEYVTRLNSPNHYGWTKAEAEKFALKNNGVNGVQIVSIRPCSGVFGNDDRHLLDPLLKLGRTPLAHNGANNVIDFVYVMNVVWGHFLAEQAIWENRTGVAGEVFCISNNNPMRLLDFLEIANQIRPGGVIRIPTPHKLLIGIAHFVELLHLIGLRTNFLITGALLNYLDLSYVFSTRKAYERLGYEPLYSVEQAIGMSVDEWQQGKMLPAL